MIGMGVSRFLPFFLDTPPKGRAGNHRKVPSNMLKYIKTEIEENKGIEIIKVIKEFASEYVMEDKIRSNGR